jgi:HPt (histidine-containing phosphotransfer) domain-containing protein
MAVLRVVIGEYSLDELLSKREIIALRMEELLDAFSHPLGIDISRVDITDVVIPTDMQRAMAREAEAQRERKARLRRAEGEVEAVKNLAHAAHTLAKNPELLELRRLQTVGELGMEQSTLITLVLPYDYGHLGGGRARKKVRYTVEDNAKFLAGLDIANPEEFITTGDSDAIDEDDEAAVQDLIDAAMGNLDDSEEDVGDDFNVVEPDAEGGATEDPAPATEGGATEGPAPDEE